MRICVDVRYIRPYMSARCPRMHHTEGEFSWICWRLQERRLPRGEALPLQWQMSAGVAEHVLNLVYL